MKRKKILILLLIVFIANFIGNKKVYADENYCLKGDEGCTVEELKPNNVNIEVACAYEVTISKGKSNNPAGTYYNLILYNKVEKKFYGATSSNFSILGELKDNASPFLVGSAMSELKSNYICPTNSYLDIEGQNEICFDSDGKSCISKSEELNGTGFLNGRKIDFSNTTSSKKLNEYKAQDLKENSNGTSYEKSCNKDNSLYKQYGNYCRYMDSEGGYILIYYNNNTNELVFYNTDSNKEIQIKAGETNSSRTGSWYESYFNKMGTINSCPNKMYVAIERRTEQGYSHREYYISNNKSDVEKYATTELKTDYVLSPCTNNDDKPSTPSKEGCELIGDTIRKYINDAMSYIRIGVPILLIGLIIFDFSSAIFADSDDKMKKAQGRVFKRIIIAIIIFFVPTLINLLFNIVNDVWANANYEICGLDEFEK